MYCAVVMPKIEASPTLHHPSIVVSKNILIVYFEYFKPRKPVWIAVFFGRFIRNKVFYIVALVQMVKITSWL